MPNPIHFDADYYAGPRRDMPWFPIVPRNAPPDDLRSYFELYSREATGMNPPWSPSHAEWDVNLPIPRMRALRGLGDEPASSTTGRLLLGVVIGALVMHAAHRAGYM